MKFESEITLHAMAENSINSEKIFCFLLISIHASSADEVWYWPK